MQTIQALAVLAPAVVFFGTALWGLWKPPADRPGDLLAEGLLVFGFAGFFNLAYPWYTLGYSARSITMALMCIAGLARVVSFGAGSGRDGGIHSPPSNQGLIRRDAS